MTSFQKIIAISTLLFSLAIAYYSFVYSPQVKREATLRQQQTQFAKARQQAGQECQKKVEQANQDHTKATAISQQMTSAGYGYMIEANMREVEEMWQWINSPQWMNGCVTRMMQEWGYNTPIQSP